MFQSFTPTPPFFSRPGLSHLPAGFIFYRFYRALPPHPPMPLVVDLSMFTSIPVPKDFIERQVRAARQFNLSRCLRELSARLLFISASFFLFHTSWNVKCRVPPLVIYSHCHAARKMTHLHSAEQRRHCTALPLSFTRCVAARAAVDMIGNFYSAQVLARETGSVTLRPGRSRSRS